MKYFRPALMIPVLLSAYIMISCSGSGGTGSRISGESIYDPGASVAAVGYSDSYPIELKVQGSSGQYEAVQEGQYLEPGLKRVSVVVKGDLANIEKVFLSNGRSYQVEAVREGQTYQGDFIIDDERLYATIFVQAIHKNQKASKRKFVFRTTDNSSTGKLILDGFGILASNEILKANAGLLASEIDTFIGDAFYHIKAQEPGIISQLSYGDNDPNTPDVEVVDIRSIHDAAFPAGVIRLSFVVHNINLSAIPVKGKDLVVTHSNDLSVEMYVAIDDQNAEGIRGLVFNILGSVRLAFRNDFFLRTVVESEIASGLTVVERPVLVADLEKVFNSLGDLLPLYVEINKTQVDLLSLFDKQNLNLSKYLFIGLYGMPESTSPETLSLGAGLFITQDKSAEHSAATILPASSHNLDGIITGLCQVMVDKAFENIRNRYKGLVTTLSYGDNNPQSTDFTINSLSIQDTGNPATKLVQTIFTINDVDLSAITLFGFSLINTQDNDLTVNASFLLSTSTTSGDVVVVLDVQQVPNVSFHDFFIGKSAIEELAKNSLESMENISSDINEIIAAISLDIDLSEVGPPGLQFPEVLEILSPYEWDLRLPEGDNISFIISQDNINRVMETIFTKDFEWDIYELLSPIMGNSFSGFNSDGINQQETIMRFSVPPVFNLRSSQIRVQVDDIFLEYRLNGDPQWEASIDLDFILDATVVDNELVWFIRPNQELCNFHIMKDNKGNLGIFDHSNLVNDILQQLPVMLGRSLGGPVFTMNLKTFEPLFVLDSLTHPITISASEGYLYIDMNALDVDLAVLKGFIVSD